MDTILLYFWQNNNLNIWFGCFDVDPRSEALWTYIFSRVPPLDQPESLLFVKNYFWKSWSNQFVDSHFSRALPLDRRDSLLFVKNYFWKSWSNQFVDPHFSHALPLDWRDLLLFEKNYFWKSRSRHLFYFILKGK